MEEKFYKIKKHFGLGTNPKQGGKIFFDFSFFFKEESIQ
jgi:hypothetical protein